MEFVKTRTSDGLVYQGLFSEPTEKTDTAILHIHGMSSNFWESEFIKTMLEKYPEKNIAFLTGENRGSELLRWFETTDGRTKLIGDAYELFEDCISDIQSWIDFLKAKGYKNIHLQGHSLGCAKVAYYIDQNNNESIKSLILISPSDMIGLSVNENDLPEYEKYMAESKKLTKEGKENELLSDIIWDFARQSAKSFINFSKENKNIAIFNYYNPELGFETIGKINIPMISFLGTKDDGITTDAYKSTEMLKENAKNCPKFEGVVFEDALHSFTGFEDEIVERVLNFIPR